MIASTRFSSPSNAFRVVGVSKPRSSISWSQSPSEMRRSMTLSSEFLNASRSRSIVSRSAGVPFERRSLNSHHAMADRFLSSLLVSLANQSSTSMDRSHNLRNDSRRTRKLGSVNPSSQTLADPRASFETCSSHQAFCVKNGVAIAITRLSVIPTMEWHLCRTGKIIKPNLLRKARGGLKLTLPQF